MLMLKQRRLDFLRNMFAVQAPAYMCLRHVCFWFEKSNLKAQVSWSRNDTVGNLPVLWMEAEQYKS